MLYISAAHCVYADEYPLKLLNIEQFDLTLGYETTSPANLSTFTVIFNNIYI
jgi:hypothetical protein